MHKKIKNFHKLARVYWHYITGKSVCRYLPLRIWLEPTDRCNLACPLCINRMIPPSEKGDMDIDLFKKIIDQLKGEICDINLFHRGEPLLHPGITNMVSYANNKGITTRIHTNATLLTREMSKSLICNGLNYISFSFDGFNKETYEKNRTGAKFEATLNNIINFLKIKKEFGMEKPYAVLQIIDTNSLSEKEKESFLDIFKGLPLDKISIRVPHNWAGGISIPKAHGKKKMITCTFPWYGLTIFRDGKVVICCQDYTGEIVIGNAVQEDLKTIWNNKILKKIRNDFYCKNYELYKPCPSCDRSLRHTIFGIPMDYAVTFFRESRLR